ncbi:MAG: hypothetical protein RLZZ111_2286, partial [Planctomycetota bacterium]
LASNASTDWSRMPRGQSPDGVPPPTAVATPAAIATTAGRRSIYASQARRAPEPADVR